MKKSAFNLANMILMTVLLSSVLFVGLTASQGEFDPWADYNGDGVIDVRDLSQVAIAYGTSGGNGKNVNVTNWPSLWQANVTNFPLDGQGNLRVSSGAVTSEVVTLVRGLNLSWASGGFDSETLTVDVSGYGEFVVYATVRNFTKNVQYAATFFSVTDGIKIIQSPVDDDIWGTRNVGDVPSHHSALFHVRSPEVQIRIEVMPFGHQDAGWVLMDISLYLRH